MSVQFTDNSIKVEEKISDIVIAWLYEVAGELTSQVQRRTPVDTGQLKNSWEYHVDESALEATVGSTIENAIWNEFGTGQYALNGDGRKTPWVYKDIKGKWHRTTGKKPQRSLYNAFSQNQAKVKKALENKLKGL